MGTKQNKENMGTLPCFVLTMGSFGDIPGLMPRMACVVMLELLDYYEPTG